MIRIFTVEKKNDVWHVKDEDGNSMTKHGSADAAIESLDSDYYIHNLSHISDEIIALEVESKIELALNEWYVALEEF